MDCSGATPTDPQAFSATGKFTSNLEWQIPKKKEGVCRKH